MGLNKQCVLLETIKTTLCIKTTAFLVQNELVLQVDSFATAKHNFFDKTNIILFKTQINVIT